MLEIPPETTGAANRRYSTTSYGTWNLSRRYGEEYREKAIDNVITRMDRWGLNTIANWSRRDVYNRNQKAFTLQMSGTGIEHQLMGLADVYDPEFAGKLITYEIGLRFLTDYLAGDVYFRVKHPLHNLERARVQFKMVEDMEQHEKEMAVQ